ncbi:MAG: hypothetical protein J6Z11_08235 [Candidatus Riflebacteria bacterium]|nr:hypothetical protein [Candidatus Riflebacteria bacterium]
MTYTFIDYEKEKAAKGGFYLETLFVAIFLKFISTIFITKPISSRTNKNNKNQLQ